MTRSCTALHVRTGDPSAVEAIDAWLQANAVEPVHCADAYEACVHLLKHAEQVPDLIFIGADWLAPDEQAIIRYARDTWPAVGLIVYGAPLAPGVVELPLTRVCGTRAELTALLSAAPVALLAHFARDSGTAATPAGAVSIVADTQPRAGAHTPERSSLRDVLSREELSALLDEDDR